MHSAVAVVVEIATNDGDDLVWMWVLHDLVPTGSLDVAVHSQ